MASAVTTAGEPRILVSALEPRIAASIRAWERLSGVVAPGFPDHVCCDPLRIVREVGPWQVTETRGVWTLPVATLMPLCDAIELYLPSEQAREELGLPSGRAYLSLERLVVGPPILDLVKAKVGSTEFELLRLSGLHPDELGILVTLAEPEPPVFDPTRQPIARG